MTDISLLHYEWRVPARPGRDTLVFLHDGLGATGSWMNLPQRIAEATGMGALAYDREGYGQSAPRDDFPYGFMEAEAPVLLELLDHLKIERPHLIGHSDGGSIALVFAALYPQRVRSVVTEAAHVFVEPETQAGIQALVDAQAAGNTPKWLQRLHGERADDLLRIWASGWLSGKHGRWNIERFLADVACPVLAIQGDQDEFGTLAQVEAIAAQVRNGQQWVAPGCGHTVHADAADAFVERVVEFLKSQFSTE
jgi:pimeloyl-ACP methyl ester carboxylesterase